LLNASVYANAEMTCLVTFCETIKLGKYAKTIRLIHFDLSEALVLPGQGLARKTEKNEAKP
jgi:hypothetical protein